MNKDYYCGLDIGTNSVGWAVTDENYNLLKFKKKDLWGIRLFESANQASERRTFRSNRRRLERRKWRIDLLQELFAEEIAKVDKSFFIRLNESSLRLDDKSIANKYPLFMDEKYTDIDFYNQYPTIYHLRNELMNSNEPHDIRMVYLALHHIVKHRGHFLIDGSLEEANAFTVVFNELMSAINEVVSDGISVAGTSDFESIILDRKMQKSVKAKKLTELFIIGDVEDPKAVKKACDEISKLIVGNKGNIEKIFSSEECDAIEK